MSERMTLRVSTPDKYPDQHVIESNHKELEGGEFEDRYVYFSGHFGRLGPHMFAAAPDLLEALEELVACVDGNYKEVTDIARAAIAKAKGGKQ